MADHQITQTEQGYTCGVCGWNWKRDPGKWGCPGVPRYAWETAPENLRTKKQLRAEKLKPGGPARGVIKIQDGWCSLYDRSEAVPVRPMSEAQKAALEKARAKAQLRHCPGCGRDVDQEVFDRRRGLCWSCIDLDAQLREAMAREKARNEAVTWARARLAEGPGCVVIDTETTDLVWPEIIELAVIGLDDTVLFHQRVRPLDAIQPGAAAVHGLTAELLADCPTWAEVFLQVRALLAGKTVVSYNIAFDAEALDYTCRKHGLPLIEATWECAMDAYALYAGEWSNYFHDWKWQPLWGGDHTALGDARAALERVRAMAASKLSSEAEGK